MKRAAILLLLGVVLVSQAACSTLKSAATRAEKDPTAYQALDLNAHFYENNPDAKLGEQEMNRIIGN